MTPEELEQMAVILIRNYINKDTLTDDEIKTNYSFALKRLANRISEFDDIPNGISTIKKGDESITYLSKVVMTKDITALLPRPYLKFY